MTKWIAPLLLLATTAFGQDVTFPAQADLPVVGKRLELATHPDGKLAFGVAYSYDTEWAWIITYTTKLTKNDLESLPRRLQWRVVDSITGKPYSQWEPVSRSQLLISSLDLRDRDEVRDVLLNQKHLTLVFASLDGQPLYYLPVGALCSTAPSFFMDLTEPSRLCDELTPDLLR